MRRPSFVPWLFPLLSQLAPGSAFPVTQQGVISKLTNFQGSRGAVASESSICSKIGIETVAMGGSAADAMVATTLCVGVIGMYHSGIGGGGFMLVRDKHGRYETINYRETAPAAASRDMYKHNQNGSIYGGLAVAVPGELKGLDYLHRKHGVLPWRTVVMPAVRIAREGFKVTEDLVRYMKAASENNNTFLVDDPIWAEDFAPNGTLVQIGDTITRKRYAHSLEKIANQGIDVFYEGEIAESMVNFIQKMNGTMTLQDLDEYCVDVKPPLNITYGDYRLFTTEVPSSGAVTFSIFKTMQQYPLEDLTDANLTAHRFVEAMKFAYGARLQLGDPDFVKNATELETQLLSNETAHEIRKRILDNKTQPVEAYDPFSLSMPESHGTSHIVTADASGLTITSTTTINLLFGAQIMTPDTGIILNNEMDDFSQPNRRNAFGFAPSPSNYIAPRKRPLSSITPLIAEHAANSSVALATGAAGGSRIISATAQVAWRVLALGLDLYDAVAAPRLHHQLLPDILMVENGFDAGMVHGFEEKGHEIEWMRPGLSAVQGIMRLWDGTFEAVGEPRQVNSGGYTI
ncbi:gamma-glutamyltranspeptidase-like protein [Corynascus novoguineensis]|uniref:Glutathione hydrolase n=1 Tax=Corynascus novoguineensis TaxID=1126955 RepID=A0AAN7CXA5_9PEZI|nr:gamma-glutamyltranspeptidase-like protein [Corynascus novoguineensis]